MSKNLASKDYYMVIESATNPVEHPIQILSTNTSVNVLRFRSCLQTFTPNTRNRNRRKWVKEFHQKSLESEIVQEKIRTKTFLGEYAHPVPDSGEISMARMHTVDQKLCSHVVLELTWQEYFLYGIVETLAGGWGDVFRDRTLQGITPAFSCRAIIPQKVYSDGSSDMIGAGSIIAYDAVVGPSHKEAYRDIAVPLKSITITPKDLEMATESIAAIFAFDQDFNIRDIMGDLTPTTEAKLTDGGNFYSVKTEEEGRILIPTSKDVRGQVRKFLTKKI